MSNDDTKLLLTEDLSSYKIALLALIKLYICEKLPSQTLLTLVKLIENKSVLHNDQLQLIINPTLLNVCQYLNETETERELLKLMWSLNSIEDIDELIKNVVKHVIPFTSITEQTEYKQISSKSLLGSFVIKIYTAFSYLKFDESDLLFQSFIQFRKSSSELNIRYGGTISETFKDGDSQLFKQLNNKLQEMDLINDAVLLPLPKNEISTLLDKQIEVLESYGTPTPASIKQSLSLMLCSENNSNINKIQNVAFNNLPSYHYLKYLESLSNSNYNESFNYLHQYFDYMVSSNSKYFYHFALISKASLHQYFNEDNKALDSIDEAISIARENKDNSTLTYILSWLFDFIKNKPNLWNSQNFYNSNDSNLLDFLISKSKDISSSLYSMSYNFKTLQMISNNDLMENFVPNLLKSLFISLHDSKPTFVKSCELASTVYSRIGESCLSEIYNELSLEYSDKLVDKLSLQVRILFSQFLQGANDEQILNDFQNIKDQCVDHSLYNSVQTRYLIILTKMNLKKGKYRLSKEIISLLKDNDNKIIELTNELSFLEIEMEMSLENYSYALNLISEVNSPNRYLTIKLNLLKCKVFNKCGQYYKFLTLLLQQIKLCKTIGWVPLYIEGMLIYLNTLNNLQHHEEVKNICQALIPIIISTNNLEHISLAYFELSKSCSSLKEKNDYLSQSIESCIKNDNLILLKECYRYKLGYFHDEETLNLLTNLNNLIEFEVNSQFQ